MPVLAPGLSPSLCLLLATLSSVEPVRRALLKALLLTLCATVPKSQGHTFGVQPSVSTVPGVVQERCWTLGAGQLMVNMAPSHTMVTQPGTPVFT